MPLLSRRMALVLIGGAVLDAPAFGETVIRQARFVDEASRDDTLIKVRAAMLAAVKGRDFSRLSHYVATNVALDFGGGRGVAELGRRLRRHPGLWDELAWVLEHGGKFQQGGFWAPYTYNAEIGKLDAFEAGVIVANTSVREQPRSDARPIAMLPDAVVRVTDWHRTDKTPSPFYRRTDWIEVELPHAQKAWIEAKHVRSVIDYRAGFTKVRGVWKMTTFIAGD